MTTRSNVLEPITFKGTTFKAKTMTATKQFKYQKTTTQVLPETFKGDGLSKKISNQIATDNAVRNQNDAYDLAGYLPPIGPGNHSLNYTNKRGSNTPPNATLTFGTQTNSITGTSMNTQTEPKTVSLRTPRFQPKLKTIWELPEPGNLSSKQQRPLFGTGSRGDYRKQFIKKEYTTDPYNIKTPQIIGDSHKVSPDFNAYSYYSNGETFGNDRRTYGSNKWNTVRGKRQISPPQNIRFKQVALNPVKEEP
jgi:hypothetical protein